MKDLFSVLFYWETFRNSCYTLGAFAAAYAQRTNGLD